MSHPRNVVLITPAKAREWLKRMPVNRPLSDNHVRYLTGTIRRGEWKVNGETIKFDESGALIDGQHRLQAIIAADTPIRSFVIYGAEVGSFDTLDGGKKRSLGDTLAIGGYRAYTTLAAALACLSRFKSGCIWRGGGHRKSIQQLESVLKDNPAITESVSFGRALVKDKLIPPGLATCLHYQFALKDKARADAFFSVLATGADLRKGTGVYLLYKQLNANARSHKDKMKEHHIAAITIKAWNADITGTEIRSLKWSVDETFPTIVSGSKQ